MKKIHIVVWGVLIFATLYSCKKGRTDIACACYVFSFDYIESNYFVEINNDGSIRTSSGMRRPDYGDVLVKEYIFRKDLPVCRDSILSDEIFPDSVFDDQGWYYNGYTHMKEQKVQLSHKDIDELNKLISKLPKHSTRNVLYGLNGMDVEHKAGVILMVNDNNYVLFHDDMTSEFYPIYKKITEISPIPIDPQFDFDSDNCVVGNNDADRIRISGSLE